MEGNRGESRPVNCKWCNGTGSIAIEPECSTRFRCPDCHGTGRASGATDEVRVSAFESDDSYRLEDDE